MSQNKRGDLISLARALGEHSSRLTLWSEGSCAIKLSAEKFLVTARGSRLSRLSDADLVEADSAALLDLIASETPAEEAVAAAFAGPDGRQASLDAAVYACLFSLEGVEFAAHTQPVEVNQILASPRARQFSDRRTSPDEIAASGVASVLVPYADPGIQLGRELKRKMLLWRDRYKTVPKLILFCNHGMIVLGRSASEVVDTTEMTIKSAQIFIGASVLGGPVFLTPNNVAQIDSMREN